MGRRFLITENPRPLWEKIYFEKSFTKYDLIWYNKKYNDKYLRKGSDFLIETTDFKEKEKFVNSILSSTLENENDIQTNDLESNIEQTELPKQDINPDNAENENTLENPEESSSEPNTIEIEDANTTNCLALTIQKDHKLVAVKNVFLHTIRMTWKVIASTVALTILKLLS